MKHKMPVILDVDTGIDDAVAIVMACYQKQLDVQLITCCFGNVSQSHVVKNTITVLENIDKQHIPVAKGASVSLDNQEHIIRAHGINGLGGYTKQIYTKPIIKSCAKAMHEVIENNDLTYIIVCGPYTNIANYIKKYPCDIGKFKIIAVTGSTHIDHNNPYLNFNILIDTPSMKYVMDNVHNIIFCTSDMGHKSYIPASQFSQSAKFGPAGEFLSLLYPHHKDRTVKDGAALHDACGVAWLVKPSMFKIAFAKAEFKVSNSGSEYLYFNYSSSSPNCVVTTDINVKKFHRWYYKTLKLIKNKK